MMIESNYEINVAKNGIHYCRIELGNIMNPVAKFDELRKFFPSEYQLTLMRVSCIGKGIKEA